MAYTKTNWENNVTPINDDNLNKIEEGIYENSLKIDEMGDGVIKLLSITEEPTTFQEKDKYYNPEDDLIYEAIDSSTWDEGITPSDTAIYLNLEDNKLYRYYDNTMNLLAGANIPIQDTAPSNPEENDLWIDTSESAGGSNILDTIFPIGSIVIKADNEDYSNWLGFTWVRTLVGRVAVGIDSTQTEFDTIGKTGGSKELQEHSHEGVSSNYGGDISSFTSAGTDAVYDLGSLYQENKQKNSTMITGIAGTGDSGNLQPYQVVAYWKRTA